MRTVIAARTDEATKKEAKRLFSRLGMDLSTAINLFLKQAIRKQGLPFEVALSEEEIAKETENEAASHQSSITRKP